MKLDWHENASITLMEGIDDRDTPLQNVSFAIQGGYLHVRTSGSNDITVFAAPGVRYIQYHLETND